MFICQDCGKTFDEKFRNQYDLCTSCWQFSQLSPQEYYGETEIDLDPYEMGEMD